MAPCEIEDCEKPRRKRGWCEMHYSRFKAHGDPRASGRRQQAVQCAHPGCDVTPLAKDLCRSHYYAGKRAKAAPRPIMEPAACSVDGCQLSAKARGWCGAHYQRWRRFGDPLHFGAQGDMECTIEGCVRVKNARGFCSVHYYRWMRYGDPLATPVRQTSRPRQFAPRDCLTCGSVFDPGDSSVRIYCGRRCAASRRGGSVNRRAWVERLGERDGWVCHLCGLGVDRNLYWPNVEAGSVDHIIPVVKGGTDAPVNLALSHLTCNVARGARPLLS